MRKGKVLTGLAGAAALAGASQAYGTVVNAPLPANIPGNDPAASTNVNPVRVFMDVDGNGTNDLQFAYRSFNTSGYYIQQSFVFSMTGQTAAYAAGTQFYDYRLAAGAMIPGTYTFGQSATQLSHIVTYVSGTEYGIWHLGDRGFIGFSFMNAGGQLDFGYVEVEQDPFVSAANPGGLRFFSAAYETSGGPIAAGAQAVPEPSTLASLAFGGLGLAAAAFKRRKNAAAKA